MNKLKKDIIDYFENKTGVAAVYIFGSFGTVKKHYYSDIDIGILLDRYNAKIAGDLITDCIVELGMMLKRDIHPVILNSASVELLRQIFTKGQCILIKDLKRLARFRMVKFVEIADFAYYRNQMQSGLIRKVMEGRTVG